MNITLYCLDKEDKQKFINPLIIDALIAEKIADNLAHATKTAICRRKKKKALLLKQTKAQRYLAKLMSDMESADDSPLIIDGKKAIDDDFIKEFMTSHMQFKKVSRDNAECYLSTLSLEKANITDDDVDNEGNVTVIVNQSYLQFSGTRSALAYLYKRVGVARPPKMISSMEKFMVGIERMTRNEKRALGLKLTEGKKPMSIDAGVNFGEEVDHG